MAGKRKAENSKSTNASTQRVEKRRKNMTEHEKQVDNAKRADSAAVTYGVKKLKKSAEWIAADDVKKEQMVQDCKDTVILKRKQNGTHSSNIEKQLGIGKGGGLYAQWDDGNPAWEDTDAEDDADQEELWRLNDEMNGDIAENVPEDVLAERSRRSIAATNQNMQELGFKIWRKKWASAYRHTICKIKKINRDPGFLKGLQEWGPIIDPKDGTYYAVQPPHMFFQKIELTIWRNFMTWATTGEDIPEEDKDMITLPGPAAWYPDDYDFEKHGFYVEDDEVGAYRAWEMLQELEEPADFEWVLPSSTTLTVLPQTQEFAKLLNNFYSK